MNRRLLGYNPEFDLLTAPVSARALRLQVRDALRTDTESTAHAVALLSASGGPGMVLALAQLVQRANAQLPSAVHRALTHGLQRVARWLLPNVATVPPVSRTAMRHRMGRWFGMELEGLSPEDQDFELARRVAQWAQAAARVAGRAPHADPSAAARWAMAKAARRYAPGLWRPQLS